MSEKKPPMTLWEAMAAKPAEKMKYPKAWMTINDPQNMIIQNPADLIIGEIPWDKEKVFPIDVNFKKMSRDFCLDMGKNAIARHVHSRLDGREERPGINGGVAERVNFIGECGQAVVCISTNRLYVPTHDTFDTIADVCGEEVKTRSIDPKHKDILVDREKLTIPGKIYWLVIGEFPFFTNWGWTTGYHLEKFGGDIPLGPYGMGYGMHRDKLFKWMPDIDRDHYVKEQLQQPVLKLNDQ